MYLPDVNERFGSRRIVFRDRCNVLRVNRCYSVYVTLLHIKFFGRFQRLLPSHRSRGMGWIIGKELFCIALNMYEVDAITYQV